MTNILFFGQNCFLGKTLFCYFFLAPKPIFPKKSWFNIFSFPKFLPTFCLAYKNIVPKLFLVIFFFNIKKKWLNKNCWLNIFFWPTNYLANIYFLDKVYFCYFFFFFRPYIFLAKNVLLPKKKQNHWTEEEKKVSSQANIGRDSTRSLHDLRKRVFCNVADRKTDTQTHRHTDGHGN